MDAADDAREVDCRSSFDAPISRLQATPMIRLPAALILAFATMTAVAADPHSHANLDQVRMTALHLDLAVDFDTRTLEGFADLDLAWDDPEARELVLDTRDLDVSRVEGRAADGTWSTLRHSLGERDPILGQPLRIRAPGQPTRVRVHYATDPTASGLQWLGPRQTMSGRHPFLFSQSQAIHARSWVPLQDSPAVRFPYRARITAPEGLRVLMSAENPAGPESGAWHFRMPQPIPSYLLAIAVGEVEAREIGPRVTIYAEPKRLDAAADEFADTERMIDVTESLYGPYRWGRYDLLILPPSFPYGGMENPRLSFITPTVIAGDRSLVSLIAHELAHSWSGNLVTNATWADFWLNEGFTTYVENRIVEALFGTDAAIMQQQVGQTELLDEMRNMAPYLQSLLPQRQGLDPDATFSSVPYDKGAWFLRTLEQRVGREVFDPFLRGWFDGHAFESADTATFLNHLRGHLLVEHPEAITDAELAEWLTQPGVPASAIAARSERLAAVDEARRRFLAGEVEAAAMKQGEWNTQEWLHFLNGLPETTSIAQLEALDATFKLTAATNSEIAFRWFMAGIRAGYEPVFEPLERFLVTVGRRKFVKPLFEALWAVPARREFATRVYAEARPRYHPVTQAAVDAIVGQGA
jgi:aminopeptidase N